MTDSKPPSMVATMRDQFGEGALRRSATSRELYTLVDVLGEAFTNHKATIEALEARIAAMEAHGVKYAGTWQRALPYRRGTVTTHDSAMWVALRDTAEGEAPGKTPDAWQLAEKVRKRVPAGRRKT